MSLRTFSGFNTTLPAANETDVWEVPPMDLDVFYRPDVVIIALYVAVLTASLSANTLLIFIVIKFQYMRRNGDLSKPTDGASGRARNFKLWLELKNLLNADPTGDTKGTEKWRKVWSDFKSNVKRKAARIYRSAHKTGGGPANNMRLSDLEERVLTIMGSRAATGIIEIPEVGLEAEEPGPPPVNDTETDDSPTIFELFDRLGESSFNVSNWNRPGTSDEPPLFPASIPNEARDVPTTLGTSAQPPLIPPPVQSRDVPDTLASQTTLASDGSVTGLWRVPEATRPVRRADACTGHRSQNPTLQQPTPRQGQSPTPLPLTPRRQRRQGQNRPLGRTRTQTQSDLARQAFAKSDCEWREFQKEAERERIRQREAELRMQERWLDLFEGFLALGNRLANILEQR